MSIAAGLYIGLQRIDLGLKLNQAHHNLNIVIVFGDPLVNVVAIRQATLNKGVQLLEELRP